MEDIKDILYDDVEQKFIELQDKKKRRHKRWKRIKRFVLLGGLIFGSIYFLSDYSKVQSLSVSGNTYFSDVDILNMADLSYETRYILMPKFLISWNLEKSDVIDSIEVEKTWNGAIHVTVKEKTILGYTMEENGEPMLVIVDNPIEKIPVADAQKDSLSHFPYLNGFDEENLQKLADAFNQKKREVGPKIIAMISEMTPYARSYDEHMVRLVMQDGNIAYSSYDGIPLLNDYKKLLLTMSKSHICLELDDTNATITSKACE